MERKAIILFNLGGPDSKESIAPFLKNFFMDKNIIRAPYFVRFFLSRLIAYRRSRKEAGESYGELGDKSPLLENSTAQAKALEDKLNADGMECKVFVCMRYWHPMAPDIAQEVKEYDPDHIVLLPLYPQFSTTTTRSSLQEWDKACDDIDLLVPTSTVCCYPFEEGFIQAGAENIKEQYETCLKETGNAPRVLFSAHGLPESVITDGDPYQWQCEETAQKTVDLLGIKDLDWTVCYQSKVGPQKWIGPSTEEEIERAANDNVPIVIYPHAFTQEHVETLVELDIEYKEVAEEHGLHGYYRAGCVGTHPKYIDGLAEIVRREAYRTWTAPDTGKRLCAQKHCRCPA